MKNARAEQEETFKRYRADGNVFPSDIPANLCDRIHAHVLWKFEQTYGPAFWPTFFKEIAAQRMALMAATGTADERRNARYRITIDCFDRVTKGDFQKFLSESGISLTTDVKSLHPTEPGWNRKLE